MSNPQVITRFAPSPTGMLHIGSARTALFNWLYARHMGGKFLLRIEDTDKARSTQPAMDAIITSMKWLGLDWDDDLVFQSHRAARHAEVVLQLLEHNKAFRCYTTQAELEDFRKKNPNAKFHSPWRNGGVIPPGVPYVIRIKAPDYHGETTVQDKVQGAVTIKNSEIDDMVLLRSDGTPTYMLAVVVDDHDMGVTHVIRGDDHLTNTFRQLVIYNAMGWRVPIFAHIPLIHGPDGAKLSKRHGALGVQEYEKMGYLPEALCNYLLRLGWSHGDDEIISREQAVKWFSLEGINKAPARLDFDKMKNLNGHYIRAADDERLVRLILPLLPDCDQEGKTRLLKAMPSLKERAKTIPELAESAEFYIKRPEPDKKFKNENIKNILPILEKIIDWTHQEIEAKIKEFLAANNLKPGAVFPGLRTLLTGSASSPGGVFEIMEILGREETLRRLENLI